MQGTDGSGISWPQRPAKGASTLGSEFARVAARVADSRVLLVDAEEPNSQRRQISAVRPNSGIFDEVQSGAVIEGAW